MCLLIARGGGDIASDSLILGTERFCVTIQSLSSSPSLVSFLEFSEGNKTEVPDRSCQWSPFGASVA